MSRAHPGLHHCHQWIIPLHYVCIVVVYERAISITLLLECPRLVRARSKLEDSLGTTRLTLLLLETKRGIEGTLEFLRTTEILTRRWYIQRSEEEASTRPTALAVLI